MLNKLTSNHEYKFLQVFCSTPLLLLRLRLLLLLLLLLLI
jgi:hypothetical protein